MHCNEIGCAASNDGAGTSNTGDVARPRDPDLDRRILASFRELADRDGPGSVSVTAVAERSGVSRPTIYRRWSSIAALRFEAQTSRSVEGGFADHGSLRDELIDAVHRLVESMVTADRALTAAMLAQMIVDADFSAEVWSHRWGPDTEAMEVMWQRAAERGEVRPDVDGRAVMDELVAVCIYQVMLSHRSFDADAVEALVDRILRGVLRAT